MHNPGCHEKKVFRQLWFWCRSPESGLIQSGSSPRVRAVLQVVVLQLDLVFDLADQNLRQEDADQLWYGQSQGDPPQEEQVAVDPVHQFVDAAVDVDMVSSLSVLHILHALATHGVDHVLVLVEDAAGEGHGAALSAGVVRRAAEVDVLGPVAVCYTPTAAKLFLTIVYEVLQVDVLSVLDDGIVDHHSHSIPSLIGEDEAQDPGNQLQQEDHRQTDAERLQEADVFSQRAHTATEGEDEHEDPHHQQHYSGVHRQTPQSGLCMFHHAGVHADSYHHQGDDPEY